MKTTNSEKRNLKKALQLLKLLFFISLGVFCIIYFWWTLSESVQQKIISNFNTANYFWLLLSIFPGLFAHWIRALRWNMLIETFGQKPANSITFHSVMAGYIANLVFPRLGEITRCAMLNRKTHIPFDKLLGSVVAERAWDMLTYFLIFFAAIAIYFSKLSDYIDDKITKPAQKLFSEINVLQWIILLAAIIFIFLLSRYLIRRFQHIRIIKKIKNIALNIKSGLISIIRVRKLWLFLLYTAMIWFGYWAMVYISFFALDSTASLPPGSALVIMAFGTIGIILVQGGIGIYPIIVSELLIYYGVEIGDGYALGWLTWSAQTGLVLILGLIAFIVLPVSNHKHE